MPADKRAPAPPAREGYTFPYEELYNNTIVGICFLKDRHIIWANPRMAEMLGYAPGELDDHDVRIIYASEEEYDRVGRLYPEMARDQGYIHERQLMRRNGEVFWCLLSGRLTDPTDPGLPSVWVLQDVSDRRLAEEQLRRTNLQLEQMVERRTRSLQHTNEALRAEVERRRAAQQAATESREKYRSLFRNLPLGVLVLDANGTVVECNRSLLSYLGARTAKDMPRLLEDPTRAFRDGQPTSLAALLRDEFFPEQCRVADFEFGWVTRDGGRRDFTVISAPRGGAVTFTFNDVTQQRLAMERERQQRDALTHASRLSLVGQMASALAHELGQPLNACQSYLAGLSLRLKQGDADLKSITHAVAKIGMHLAQATEIMRNVRGFVSRRPTNFTHTDLTDLIRRTITLMEGQLRTAGVRPLVTAADRLPQVSCTPVEIQQVFVNLMLNALDAMHDVPADRRRLEIRLAPAKHGMLAVTVSDSGPGVPPTVADHLFEPYFTTKPAGLGMGLMICRNIVESHGGAIELLPSGGAGGAFRFTLRIVD